MEERERSRHIAKPSVRPPPLPAPGAPCPLPHSLHTPYPQTPVEAFPLACWAPLQVGGYMRAEALADSL